MLFKSMSMSPPLFSFSQLSASVCSHRLKARNMGVEVRNMLLQLLLSKKKTSVAANEDRDMGYTDICVLFASHPTFPVIIEGRNGLNFHFSLFYSCSIMMFPPQILKHF